MKIFEINLNLGAFCSRYCPEMNCPGNIFNGKNSISLLPRFNGARNNLNPGKLN